MKLRDAVGREARRLSLVAGKEPPTVPTVARKLNSTESGWLKVVELGQAVVLPEPIIYQ